MDYLVLDTNIYINLCLRRSESVTAPCLQILQNLIDEKKVTIILPEVVANEFWKNIMPAFENSKAFIKKVMNQIDQLFLPQNVPNKLRMDIKDNLKNLISKYNDATISNQVYPVSKIMSDKSTQIIEITDDLLLKTIKRVIVKKAPAHNVNKRSECDCLIVESILSYFNSVQDKEKVFFVTDNKADFSNSTNADTIHPDLEDDFKELGIEYSRHLTKILKDHFQQDIDEKESDFFEESLERYSNIAHVFYQSDKLLFFGQQDPNIHPILHSTYYPYGSGEEACVTITPSTGPVRHTDVSGMDNFKKNWEGM